MAPRALSVNKVFWVEHIIDKLVRITGPNLYRTGIWNEERTRADIHAKHMSR
jgi:hypothetical protein